VLLPNVYMNGNGGYRAAGDAEGVYHVETGCPTVRQSRGSLEYVADVREMELCPTCRQLQVDRRGPHFMQGKAEG
jgi:hypothetical protein